MATQRNRNGKWHVQVRRNGHPPRTRSFLLKADTQKWGRRVEAEIDAAVIPCDPRRAPSGVILAYLVAAMQPSASYSWAEVIGHS